MYPQVAHSFYFNLNFKGQLFKWCLALVKQNCVLNYFEFSRRFYLNTIYRDLFWKHLFPEINTLGKRSGGPVIS